MVFGIKFSGFIAWWFWRSVYLMKLPRLAKKLRVMVSWTLDLFRQEIEQMITVRDIEASAVNWRESAANKASNATERGFCARQFQVTISQNESS